MKRFGMTVTIFLFLFLLTFGVSILLVSGRTTGYLKQMRSQKTKIRAVESLDAAQQELQKKLSAECQEIAEAKYDEIIRAITNGSLKELSEEKAEETFKKGYVNRIKRNYGNSPEELCKRIESYLPKIKTGTLSIDRENTPAFAVITDDATGIVSGCEIRGVTVTYNNGTDYQESRSYDFVIYIPRAYFFDGDDELFEYSLIGNKGIYVTGKTSSIVGNIFAGTHAVGENRKAEAGYGEKDTFGGLNILSTQLGVQADHIVSAGDINLKGAFVIFGSDEVPVSVYAKRINQMSVFPETTSCQVNGTQFLHGDTAEETGEYGEISNMVKIASGKLFKLEYYYDSDNDINYQGDYRKILADSDVTVRGDFTGVIITSGNVIIESGCNMEGLILTEDRIYVRGNNNIVSNLQVLREMIYEDRKETLETTVLPETEDIPRAAALEETELPAANTGILTGEEEEAVANSQLWKNVSHNLLDYIGGLSLRGLYDDQFIYVEMLQEDY